MTALAPPAPVPGLPALAGLCSIRQATAPGLSVDRHRHAPEAPARRGAGGASGAGVAHHRRAAVRTQDAVQPSRLAARGVGDRDPRPRRRDARAAARSRGSAATGAATRARRDRGVSRRHPPVRGAVHGAAAGPRRCVRSPACRRAPAGRCADTPPPSARAAGPRRHPRPPDSRRRRLSPRWPSPRPAGSRSCARRSPPRAVSTARSRTRRHARRHASPRRHGPTIPCHAATRASPIRTTWR